MASTTVPPQFASSIVPPHEHVSDANTHNYMNIEEINAISLPPPRKQLSVSNSDSDAEPKSVETAVHKVQDSFYASDDEDLSFTSPIKPSPSKKPEIMEKPVVKERPVPLPRKQDSVTSYENEDAIQTFKSQVEVDEIVRESIAPVAAASTFAAPQEYDIDSALRAESEVEYDLTTSITDTKEVLAPKDELAELYDYENSSFDGLPSYEEAVSAEFFNLDDIDTPPPIPPMRDDSQQATEASISPISDREKQLDSSFSDEVMGSSFNG